MDRTRGGWGRSARPQGRALLDHRLVGRQLVDHRLVGRQTLLDRVDRQLDGSRRVVLRGDAGVGKSRLLHALADRAARPVVRFGPGPGEDVTPDGRNGGSAEDLCGLHEPTDAAGVLVLVDDLDALPPVAQAQLHRLADESWCTVVAATRRAAVDGTAAPWTCMHVPPLSRLGTGELLTEALHGVVDPAAVAAIHTASGGNPAAIVDLAHLARERGCLVEGRDAWELIGALPIAPFATTVRTAGPDPAARTTRERIAVGGSDQVVADDLVERVMANDGELSRVLAAVSAAERGADATAAGGEPRAAAWATMAQARASASIGAVDEATDASIDERAARTRPIPLADDLVRGIAWLAAIDRTPQDAIIATRGELDRGLRHGGPLAAWWSFVHGQLHLRAGELRAARVRFVEAELLIREVDPLRLRPRVIAGQALVAATSGMITHAGVLLEKRTDGPVVPRVATTRGLVEALLLAAERGASAGAVHALAVGDEALEAGRRADALEAWHLAVRLDLTSGVTERIDALVDGPRARPHPWIELVGDHARALVAADADGLRRVAARAVALGWRLVAAEAAAQAARYDPTDARRALAAGLAAGCPDADTPAIQRVERVVLTPRRREAALYAMRGCSGAAIAERLGVSARTVENHLAAVYRGLGVRGRRELVAFYTVDRGPFTDATAVA